LSPEIKIISYLGFVVGLFFVNDSIIYLLIFAAISILLCMQPFQSIRRGWVPISFFLIFTFLSNVLLQHGKILLKMGSLMVTEEGLSIASLRTARVFFMIAGAKILTATTTTESLIEAFGKILNPLERLGIPVNEFSSTMGLAIKSLPRIKDQITRTYREKMENRDADGFWNRTKAISQFLIPLFVKSIQTPESYFEDEPNRKEEIPSD
jgi:energy-coupling factor transport system permease protein